MLLISSQIAGHFAPDNFQSPSPDNCSKRQGELDLMRQGCRDIVIFDLGGVLIDWNPRHLYRKLFAGDEAAMEAFLETVCTHD
jgi:hypothetical protein